MRSGIFFQPVFVPTFDGIEDFPGFLKELRFDQSKMLYKTRDANKCV